MDVSLDQKAATTATKEFAGTHLDQQILLKADTGEFRSVAGHLAERADSMLPVDAMKYSANTIAHVGYQYEQYTRKLSNRNKCVAKH